MIDTLPAGGTRIAKGGAVTINVSTGPLMVQIPKVVGVTITDAKSRIAEQAFPDPTVVEEWSDTVPKDEVMSCSPDQETMVRHNAAITLTVSKGPEPITIPNVVGATLTTAQSTLSAYALNVSVQHGRTLDVATGQIYKQDPAGDAAGVRAQDMTIWVSDGKPFVVIPDFTLKPVDEEVQRAQDQGQLSSSMNSAGVMCADEGFCGSSEALNNNVFTKISPAMRRWPSRISHTGSRETFFSRASFMATP